MSDPLCILIVELCFRYHEGTLYVIDVSQSVEHDHPHALEFLRKDCNNVNGMFSFIVNTLKPVLK